MINTLETTLQEGNPNGKTEVTEIVNHKDTDNGHVEERLSINGECVKVDVALYPCNSSIQKIEASRKYRGTDRLEIRAKAANFIHSFEKDYCENHDECIFHEMYHNPNSTSGQDMKKSIAKYGKKSGSYNCSICSGHDQSCDKYTVIGKPEEKNK